MNLYAKKEECCGCSACADICPVNAVHMISDGEGFQYPRIDKKVCIRCQRCEQVCPIKNSVNGDDENLYYGAQAKNSETRYASSSGGVFPILAEYVFSKKGVVYGAAYNKRMEVVHREAHNKKELELLKKTKYVQSNLDGIYCKIQSHLEEGRWVLFCGTPCQAHALRLFLEKSYERLVVVSLICYGVPSPGIWNHYVKYLENRHHGKLDHFFFRDKRNRDNGHVRSYVMNTIEYTDSFYHDIYCRMYATNLILRPSCHQCKFCTVDRDSDFTIGDFWGIEHVREEFDDGMGTSVVILHTQRAKEIWEQIKEELLWFACEKKDVLQPRLLKPTDMAKRRQCFMMFYKILPFSLFLPLLRKAISACTWFRRLKE
ncbi:MAG: 4Fe-4S dicluster domain-containing protein [Lachnospiraceae bacterium]|nr:4Fe-4S dicluster domain-containing protein [Lachnospiraceae bacterium]